MRSSQQLCLSTAPLQVSPVLSAMVPEVPVVRMLSGRNGDSWGSCNDMMARLLIGTMYGDLLGRDHSSRNEVWEEAHAAVWGQRAPAGN